MFNITITLIWTTNFHNMVVQFHSQHANKGGGGIETEQKNKVVEATETGKKDNKGQK